MAEPNAEASQDAVDGDKGADASQEAADAKAGPETAEDPAASDEADNGLIGIERIQQLKVKVQAVLGATPLSVYELANLERGDIIKLDTKVGDPISILANGDEIARAEIVVTQDQPPRFGLTLTDVIHNVDTPD